MRGLGIESDNRGASIAVTHALTLAITAILISTLLLATGNFLNAQNDDVARQQLTDIGGDVSSLIDRADRLNKTGSSVNATFETTYTNRVAGEPYTIILIPDNGTRDTEATMYLNATALDISVAMRVSSDTPMIESRVRAGNPTVSLCNAGTKQNLTLTGCPR